MPYLMSDDGFPEHRKVDPLSDGAFRLHVAGMHFCAREMSDGIIPDHRAPRLKPRFKPSELRELLASRLWHNGGEGCGTDECPTGKPGEYVVHDYLQWNKSADWWEQRRKTEAERMAKYRAKTKGKGLRIV